MLTLVLFPPIGVTWDPHSSTDGLDRKGFVLRKGGEGRCCPTAVRVKTFIKASLICEAKCYFSGMAPKGSAETTYNKDVNTSWAAGGTGAEKWAPPTTR